MPRTKKKLVNTVLEGSYETPQSSSYERLSTKCTIFSDVLRVQTNSKDTGQQQNMERLLFSVRLIAIYEIFC